MKTRTVKESLTPEQSHVWCDAKEEKIPAKDCAIRHMSAGLLHERNERQGKPSKFNACRCCQTGIEQLYLWKAREASQAACPETNQAKPEAKQAKSETKQSKPETNQNKSETKQEKTMTNSTTPLGRPFKPGPCPACGEARKVFRNKGVCQICARIRPQTKAKIKSIKDKIKAKSDIKNVMEAKESFEQAIDDHLTKKTLQVDPDPELTELVGPARERCPASTLVYHIHALCLSTETHEKLVELAGKQLRTPENQALWILMEALR